MFREATQRPREPYALDRARPTKRAKKSFPQKEDAAIQQKVVELARKVPPAAPPHGATRIQHDESTTAYAHTLAKLPPPELNDAEKAERAMIIERIKPMGVVHVDRDAPGPSHGPTTSVGGDYAFGDPVIRLPTEMYQRMRDGERILMWYATDGVTLHVQTEEEAWDMEFDQPDGMDAIID